MSKHFFVPRSNVQPGTAQCNPIVSISPFCVQCHAPLPPTHSLLPPPRRHHTFTTATHTFTPKKTPRCSKHSLIIFHNPPPKRKMFFITFYSFYLRNHWLPPRFDWQIISLWIKLSEALSKAQRGCIAPPPCSSLRYTSCIVMRFDTN